MGRARGRVGGGVADVPAWPRRVRTARRRLRVPLRLKIGNLLPERDRWARSLRPVRSPAQAFLKELFHVESQSLVARIREDPRKSNVCKHRTSSRSGRFSSGRHAGIVWSVTNSSGSCLVTLYTLVTAAKVRKESQMGCEGERVGSLSIEMRSKTRSRVKGISTAQIPHVSSF